jgi:hypothetical protein
MALGVQGLKHLKIRGSEDRRAAFLIDGGFISLISSPEIAEPPAQVQLWLRSIQRF